MGIGRNDPCPCGSGKKYKKCHLGLPQAKKTSDLSLSERNLILLDAISDIFGFNRGVQWQEIKRTISGDQVRQLYQVVGALWPPDTNLSKLLPTPDAKLRALYLGDTLPELLPQSVFRLGLYADEILIVNPFFNPWCIAKEYNPIANPDQYKQDTLKLISFVGRLEPWIRHNLVTLIPDPGDFDYLLRRETWKLAEEQCKSWTPAPEDLEEFEPADQEDLSRFFLTLPDSYKIKQMRELMPGITEQQIAENLEEFERMRKTDPLALDQGIEEAGGQIQR